MVEKPQMRIEPAKHLTIFRHAAVCLLYLAASWVFYAPPRHWPGLTYFGDEQDSLAFIWFLNWWPFALTHHLPLLFTHYVDYPAGTDLVWKTSIPALGLLAAPFTLRFGAAAVFNVLMIAAPALAAFALYLAAWELTGVFAAALLAGAMFACSGYEIGQTLGHLNLAFTAAVPFSLWACLRAAAHNWPRWHLGAVLGGLFLFEFGVSQEVFASEMLFGAAALLLLAWLAPLPRPALGRLLGGILLGLALCLLLAAPFIWAMLRGYAAARANFSTPDVYANDLLAAFIPTPLVFLGGHPALPLSKLFTGNSSEQGGYYGLPLVLLALHIWRTTPLPAARVLAGMALLAVVASLGPYVHVLGHRLGPAPWLPFAQMPVFAAMLPGRFALYAWLSLTLLLALWLAQPGSGWRRYALAGLCLLSLLPAQSTARNWRQPMLPPVFATLPPGAHVLVMPVFAQEMGWQYAAGMRFMLAGQGYIGNGQPAPFSSWPLYQPLWENRFPAIAPGEFSAYLQAYDVQYVVLLPQGYAYYSGKPVDEAAETRAAATLLQQAGWRIATATPRGAVYQPSATTPRWTPAQIAGFIAQGTQQHRADVLPYEIHRVCQIRRLARLIRLNPAPLLYLWALHAHPLVPAATLACPLSAQTIPPPA
ncbi:hypothetical protein GCM10010909_19830 [Acidocella aquatica]|uniref:Uncharacterized protein n=1 Tax=Acidocella aquatica TaxID=1922313 RepID=A0ABQ6A7P5_9PROT|nr:hypothetical protein [Acidocella aquatica]GLR67302.1 hypothetical protein GCM10010909_19830 [Acidocella aquatica]